MQSFISETLEIIVQKEQSFENVELILPSQRAGVFVKELLKHKISAGFLPKIRNIGDFIEEVSEMQKVDSIQLLFHLYGLYKEVEEQPDNFAAFSTWAFTVVQDFNEIDKSPHDIVYYRVNK